MGWQDEAEKLVSQSGNQKFLKLEAGKTHKLFFGMEPRVAYTLFDRSAKRTIYLPWGDPEGTCSYYFGVFNLELNCWQSFKLPDWRCRDLIAHLKSFPNEAVLFTRMGEKEDTRYMALRCSDPIDRASMDAAAPVDLVGEAGEFSYPISQTPKSKAPAAPQDTGYDSSEAPPF